jgi:hypothetical protein
MKLRNNLVAALAAAIFLLSAQIAHAGQPIVEVISLPHWPVQDALKPIDEVLAKFGDKILVIKLNADEEDGKKRLKSVGQKGHIPALILIDGMYRYTRPDGTRVEFINFPGGTNSPMGIDGSWTPEDVEAAVRGRLK